MKHRIQFLSVVVAAALGLGAVEMSPTEIDFEPTQPAVFLLIDEEEEELPPLVQCANLTTGDVRHEWKTGSPWVYVWKQDCLNKGTCPLGSSCQDYMDPNRTQPCKCQ